MFPLKWPRTYIVVGVKDAVRDEVLLFMQRMIESKIPAKCFLY
jgi:hypothetical protein